jgi:hypothetical protein
VTSTTRWADGSSVHGNAPNEKYTFPKDYMSVLHDPYALNYIRDIPGDRKGKHDDSILDSIMHPADQLSEWMSWVNVPYLANKSSLDTATNFADEASNKNILSSAVKLDGIGDSLDTPPITWSTKPEKLFSSDMAPSGWADSRVSATGGALQNSYMGVDPGKW